MNAEQILKIIESMENAERWKLLNEMYNLYYNKGIQKNADIDY
ncbi:hypothetical protein [Peribacillus frigoritolerans]|nr:hypothetical protein [Peribacillus frigoritolerans]